MSETTLLHQLMLAITRTGTRVFRNHVGLGWQGKAAEVIKTGGVCPVEPGDVVIRRARPLHAGLHVGSSDLIGWKPVTITQDLVGSRVAVFAAIEAKVQRRKLTPEQRQFLEQLRQAGGIAIEARDVDTTVQTLNSTLTGVSQ